MPLDDAAQITVTPATTEAEMPYDPLNPPLAAIHQAADLLAREMLFRGVKPEVFNQPANHAFLVVVPGPFIVDVRGGFYSWDDPAADYGGRSHALWGDHVDAAARIVIAAGLR